jgi:hypothetical protein
MSTTLRCEHCDDVIGVYEPMIVLEHGRTRDTSRAAEQVIVSGLTSESSGLTGECYHVACYEQAHGTRSTP